MSDDENAPSALRQKLMSADEVYVYKIPTLKTSGGHRAEDWDLSKPLQTCSLLVERRGDVLVLEFYHDNNSKQLFAASRIDITTGQKVQHWIEQVVDSSRYFVLKIQGAAGRQALIGFGFRDRDQATDLRESLQHYEKSIARQANSASLSGSFSIPKMEKGEKIHVNRSGGGSKSTKMVKKKEGSTSSSNGSGPIPLLKKPPPSPDEPEKAKPSAKMMKQMMFSMGDLNLDDDDDDDEDATEDSGGAVYEGDEEQWATEFDMK